MVDKKIKIGWIDIIAKMYKDLHNSEEVLHYSSASTKKIDRLIEYFEKLEVAHKKVSESKRKKDELILKKFYYNLYVIKEDDIEEKYFQNQARILRERGYGNIKISLECKKQIIENQKESLDKWVEFFLYDEEGKLYEMWKKYWVFQGIKSLGKYDKETGKFSKRDKNTIYPFPPVNKEYIFTTIKLMEEYIKDKTGDKEIKSALGNGNFKKIYEFVIKQSMKNVNNKEKSIEGKWIKYEQGSDYFKLISSLQGYYTGWCTAEGDNFAKSQIKSGDFYVYYSLDKNGDAKVPRIAIRMDGKTKIGEIKGIDKSQNIEVEMVPILNEKLKEFPDKDNYLKKEKDMNILTFIDNKVKNNRELTIEELKFLYEINHEVMGFGYDKDPRIEEIKIKRNKRKDCAKIFDVLEEEVAFTYNEWQKNSNKIKVFPESLDLRILKTPQDLILPSIYVKNLNLMYLKTIKSLRMPQIIGGDLNLMYLEKFENIQMPQIIRGNLYLNNLKTVEGLMLPYNYELQKLICNSSIKEEILKNPNKYFLLPDDNQLMEERTLKLH